jgi:hypothetical protein
MPNTDFTVEAEVPAKEREKTHQKYFVSDDMRTITWEVERRVAACSAQDVSLRGQRQ